MPQAGVVDTTSHALGTRLKAAVQLLSTSVAEGSAGLDDIAGQWSRSKLLARAATFDTSRWFAPQAGLDPLECARFGWEVVGVQTLGCVSCGERIIYNRKVRPQQTFLDRHAVADIIAIQGISARGAIGDMAETSEGIEGVRKYVRETMTTGHKPECPWRGNPCPVTMIRLPEQQQAMQEISRRITALRCMPCAS